MHGTQVLKMAHKDLCNLAHNWHGFYTQLGHFLLDFDIKSIPLRFILPLNSLLLPEEPLSLLLPPLCHYTYRNLSRNLSCNHPKFNTFLLYPMPPLQMWFFVLAMKARGLFCPHSPHVTRQQVFLISLSFSSLGPMLSSYHLLKEALKIF